MNPTSLEAIRQRLTGPLPDWIERHLQRMPPTYELCDVAEIASHLRRLADHRYWSPGPHGYRGPLADVLVHSGDIRIPLGLPFEPEPHLAAQALDRLTQPTPTGLVPVSRLRGIRLRANDIERTWRKGKEIHGPVAALMMAAGGRTALLDALDGPGLPLLRQRISG